MQNRYLRLESIISELEIFLLLGRKFDSILLEKYFGEGIAVLNKKLVQLTWKGKKAFVYSFPQLKMVDTYFYTGEGWGLTSDSSHFMMSNGSDTIYIRDSSFNISRKIAIKANGQPVQNLNELEYVNGKLFANIWYKDNILEIDLATGEVLRIIDCKSLLAVEKPKNREQVLNGIAYNPEKDTFFITGKHWKLIFEVSIPQTLP